MRTGQVSGHPDAELNNKPRTRPVRYKVWLPAGISERQPAQGLFVYIAGFGDDNTTYEENLCRHIAGHHGMAALTVDYHAKRCRVGQEGVTLYFKEEQQAWLRELCRHYGLTWDVNNVIEILVELGERVPDPLILRGVLVPPDQEYQNFGVLQALDHLRVIQHLQEQQQLPFDPGHIVLAGSSHGGYLAHLIAKMAPNTINAIIDNSSYTAAPLNYLGILEEAVSAAGKLSVILNTLTAWQFTDKTQPGYYDISAQLMRDVAYSQHITHWVTQAERLPQVIAYNSVMDGLSSAGDKRYQHQLLQAAGASCHLQIVEAADLDGKRFKTLDHGMAASMKTLITEALPTLSSRPTTLDWQRGTTLRYDGGNKTYRIQHQVDKGVSLAIES